MTPIEHGPEHDRMVDERLAALESPVSKEMKAAVKEALKEWMDEKFKQVGMFTVNGILVAGLGALVYFILTYSGWHQEP